MGTQGGGMYGYRGMDDHDDRGLIQRCIEGVFALVDRMAVRPWCSTSSTKMAVHCNFVEVRTDGREQIRDLLAKTGEEDSCACFVKNSTQANSMYTRGVKNRAIRPAGFNFVVRASHTVFTLIVETAEFAHGEMKLKVGKLKLVELLGSVRQHVRRSSSAAEGARGGNPVTSEGEGEEEEEEDSNPPWRDRLRSLRALGDVIAALSSGEGGRIPYGDSVLTQLLQDSLGGSAKTVMCFNCGPADYNYDATMHTLAVATRCKGVKNHPRVNEDLTDAKLRPLQEQIAQTQKLLLEGGGPGGGEGEGQEGYGLRGAMPYPGFMSEDETKRLEQEMVERFRRVWIKKSVDVRGGGGGGGGGKGGGGGGEESGIGGNGDGTNDRPSFATAAMLDDDVDGEESGGGAESKQRAEQKSGGGGRRRGGGESKQRAEQKSGGYSY